jgi:tetratricopeptide (TPR) repeat protein
MGAFFDSIHVRNENPGTIQKILERLAKEEDCKFLLGPKVKGWTSILPSVIGCGEAVSTDIAKGTSSDIFHLMVHDDDVFSYYFYHDGKLADQYNSNPDYFKAVSKDENKKSVGRPDLFQDLLPEEKSLSRLKKLLARKKFAFESERMTQFVELLGLPNSLTSYDYFQQGEHDEIEGREQFIHVEHQPVSAEDYNKRGEARLAKGDLENSLADFNKAIELNPKLSTASDNRARVEQVKGEQNGKMAQVYTHLGQQCREGNNLDGAMSYYNKAIELDPKFAVAYSGRGIVKKSRGDLDGALADFNEAIELKEDLPVTHMRRAAVKEAKGDSEGALSDYNRAIELKPDSAMAHNNRGELRRKKGDADGALEDYNRAIELKPDSAIFYSNRSIARMRKKDLDGALADSNQAIKLKSDLAPAYNNRGMVKQLKGDLDGALEDYNKAIELNPNMAAFKTNRDKAVEIKKSQNR